MIAIRPPRNLDLRLAGAAIACWLTALAVLHGSAGTAVTVAVGGSFGAGVAAFLANRCADTGGPWPDHPGDQKASRTGPMLWTAAGVLLGAVIGAAATAPRLTERDAVASSALARDNASVTAAFTTSGDPRPIGGVGAGGRVAIQIRLRWLQPDGGEPVLTSAQAVLLASGPTWARLLPGQQVLAQGRLGSARGGGLDAVVLAVQTDPERVGPVPLLQRAAGGLRAGLRQACAPLPGPEGGLLPGLVIGDTSRLDPAVAAAFKTTGMTHLVAVSGSNCAMITGVVLLLSRRLRMGQRSSAAFSGLALAGFVVLVRPTPSVLRAAAMGGLALFAMAAGRARSPLPALAATVIVLIGYDPGLACDLGFALSVLATAGLMVLAGPWAQALRRHRVPWGLAEAIAVPAAAQVACAPLIAAMSGTVSLTAVPANMLAVPAIPPATFLGVGCVLAAPISQPAAQFLAWLAAWPARWLIWIANLGATMPAGSVPWLGGAFGGVVLAALLVVAMLVARNQHARRTAAVLLVAAAVGAVPVRLVTAVWPPPGTIAVVCDVGQGDLLVLPAGDETAIVVDAGPDVQSADRCLHDLGVSSIALLVITHFHADHVEGLAGVLRGRTLSTAVGSPLAEPAVGRSSSAAATAGRGAVLRDVVLGEVYDVGSIHLEVLGPAETIRGSRSDPNNNSVVLMATVAGRRILLVGDAEAEEQASIMARSGRVVRSDVLKVAHHGSSYQDPAFLAGVAPGLAAVSVGAGNRYGQPSAATIDRLRVAGTAVTRTDLDGDLAVRLVRGNLLLVRRSAWSSSVNAGAELPKHRSEPIRQRADSPEG